MNAPTAKKVYQIKIDNFTGIDLRNSPSKVATSRSPNCVNMIRETVGNNRKRYGYETLHTFDGRINGIHTLQLTTGKITIIHAGTKIYSYINDTATLLYSNANDHFSMSKQINGKLYFIDGANLLSFDGTQIKNVSDDAYIPTVTIAKTYQGGGTSMEPYNLLTPWRTERFRGDSTHTTFQLGSSDIDSDEVKIKSMTSEGVFADLKENTDFTVNRTLGTFTLNAAKATPITGEDNLYVTYAKTIAGYADKIKKCDICTLFGINGARDRMFVAGNPDFPHYDWYCRADDPTMWGDIWYCVTGQDDSAIVGYSIVNDYLAVHKNSPESQSNLVLRTGTYDSDLGATVFKTNGTYAAAGALGKHGFQTLDNEPLYVTIEKSIHAMTSTDVLGDRISQERSYYISSELAKEPNLENAYSCYHDGFYMLAVGDRIYILDSTQVTYEKNMPYSTRQYECYLWEGIGARVLNEIDGRLFFGTEDGKLKRFLNANLNGFKDDGQTHMNTVSIDGVDVTTEESFPCYWDTCEIYGNAEELKKTFKHLAVCLNAYTHTGCRIWAKIDGIWEVIFDYDSSANFFDFREIDFDDLSFRTDDTSTIVGGKFKAKKILHIQFRFENSKPQPFSVLWAKAKYTVGNEYIK